ncbi:MAG TPA: molybdopterin dinucleotide binding domain-containing protein [Gemmataceae bacterium]|nr:molybdopterin dinucleotide binding domain-containing protein [Gemmataceae bacterium]
MAGRRFIMNAGRTSKQGQQINIGKDHLEYQTIVSTVTMHPEDMRALSISAGGTIRVRSEHGEATFRCQEGKVPQGMLFVPYGPPTCRLMGGSTDGTGMPTSKGWEVEVEPIAAETTS